MLPVYPWRCSLPIKTSQLVFPFYLVPHQVWQVDFSACLPVPLWGPDPHATIPVTLQSHQVSECHLYTILFLLLSHTPTTYVRRLAVFIFHKLHQYSVESSPKVSWVYFNLFRRLEDCTLSGTLPLCLRGLYLLWPWRLQVEPSFLTSEQFETICSPSANTLSHSYDGSTWEVM